MRTIPGLSIDTKMIQDRLSRCATGEIVRYSELSELIGRDIQNGARNLLHSAMRRLLADGKAFATVRCEGVKRLSDAEVVGEGPAALSRLRRAASRASRKLAAVQDFNALPREAQTTHNMTLSVLGVLAHMTKPSTVRQLEARIDQAQAALPLAKTLEALGKS
jgi:hypothetical protein